MNEPITINIKQYLKEKKQRLFNIINKERRILLVANPGTGKTKLSVELMKKQKEAGHRFIYATFLTAIPKQHKEFNFDLICSSYESKWNDRREETRPGDNLLTEDELIIGTTLQQLLRFEYELTENDIIVLDEAHVLVQKSEDKKIYELREQLKSSEAKLLLMTGTPYEKEDERLDLTTVNVIEANPRIDKLIYLPLTSSMKEGSNTNIGDMTLTFVDWYFNEDDNFTTKKILIFQNNLNKNEELQASLKAIGYTFDNLSSKTKDSDGYQHLIDNQKIRDKVHGVITTSVIKEGINIKNDNIDIIIVIGHLTLKDEKQISKRIRRDNSIEVFRIYEEPTEDKIVDIIFDISFIETLTKHINSSGRLKKALQRLSKREETVKYTSIFDDDVKKINEIKAIDILEQMHAQKCNLDDFLGRNIYNDMEMIDGYNYLDDKYDLMLADHESLGDYTDTIKAIEKKLRIKQTDNLETLLQFLFGFSRNFEIVIKLLKGDILGYFNEGKQLRNITPQEVSDITNADYENPKRIGLFDDADDDELKDLSKKAIKIFSTKYPDQLKSAIQVMHFLIKHADDTEDVLPVFNEALKSNDIDRNAKVFSLSVELDRINAISKLYNRRSIQSRPLSKLDKDRLEVMKHIKSQVGKYTVVHTTLLKQFIINEFPSKQYAKKLSLNNDVDRKIFVEAMGITEEVISWKCSGNNKVHFNKLWKDLKKPGTPKSRDAFRVIKLDICKPNKQIEDLADSI